LYWSVPRLWPGACVAILGGGPSLKGVDLSPLAASGVRVVAVNRALEIYPAADLHFAADAKWYRLHGRTLAGFAGLRVTCCGNDRLAREHGAERLLWLRAHGRGGTAPPALSKDPSALRGECSGGLALNMAYRLGARRILLLGYDFKAGPAGETHWHDGYEGPCRARDAGLWRNKFMPAIERMAPALQAEGVEVVNCNPDSALRCFPFATLEEALSDA